MRVVIRLEKNDPLLPDEYPLGRPEVAAGATEGP